MRTVSTKLDNGTHKLFLEICNNEGKYQSEMLRDMIQNVCERKEIEQNRNESSQDLGQKLTNNPIPEITITEIFD